MIATFHMPATIVSGYNSSAQLMHIVQQLSIKRLCMFVSSSLEVEVKEYFMEILKKDQISLSIYSCKKGEPTSETVEHALQVLEETASDGIVAIGGGSVIDLAKAVSVFALNKDKNLDNINLSPAINRLPLIAIPTTAGSGSEATSVMVIKEHKTKLKKNPSHPSFIPDVVILDERWLRKLPKKMVVFTGLDALTHAIEAYVSTKANSMTDLYALRAVKLIYMALPKIYEDSEDESAYSDMLLGSTYAGIAFSNASTNLAHATARAIGAKLNIPHGLSVALLHPFVIRFSMESCQERYAEMATALGISSKISKDMLAQEILRIVEDFNDRFGIWEEGRVYAEHIDQQSIRELTEQTLMGNGINTNRKIPRYEDIETIFNDLSNKLSTVFSSR